MGRSVPKCKRAPYVKTRDFIVVDDISGVWKLRSQCAIDGYGFLSSDGDPRHPQETPPDIREQMAAWPDPRPISPPTFQPDSGVVYFIGQYDVVTYDSGVSATFNGANSIGLNGIITSIAWYCDNAYVGTAVELLMPLSAGTHSIRMHFTDQYGNEGDYTFSYTLLRDAMLTLETSGFLLQQDGSSRFLLE